MKTKVEEVKLNEVDWSKTPQLVVDDNGGVVLVVNMTSNNTFAGVVVHPPDGVNILGNLSESYIKAHFKPFNGTVTLQND